MYYVEQAKIEGASAARMIQQDMMLLPRQNQAGSINQIREFYNAVGPAMRNFDHMAARNDSDEISANQRVNNMS